MGMENVTFNKYGQSELASGDKGRMVSTSIVEEI